MFFNTALQPRGCSGSPRAVPATSSHPGPWVWGTVLLSLGTKQSKPSPLSVLIEKSTFCSRSLHAQPASPTCPIAQLCPLQILSVRCKVPCQRLPVRVSLHVRRELNINKRKMFNISLNVTKHGALPGREIVSGCTERRQKEKLRKTRQGAQKKGQKCGSFQQQD